ncbi:NAD(P)H-dependent oxidoreductase [Aquirufa echingensis]|jgi:nitroreductase/dihydropteridine reductase|uniref:NAD(P)H-dependent oxidoreductase n=1 Tax=Aquirufa echingensis TaxID=3096516 RepID=A0ABW6D8V2_9BACT
MSLINDLSWRYATKRMNGNKVSADKIESLLDAIRLSASGFGLQPYQVFVIENPELRAQIQPIAYGQPQITEASHILVFAAWNDITEEKIDAFIQLVSETRNVPVEALADYRGAIAGSMLQLPMEVQAGWAARQVYLAMGTALAAAAELKIDTTPMEGFVPAKLDELLDLSAKGLHSVLILAVGERDAANDYMANAAKVRYSKDELFVRM